MGDCEIRCERRGGRPDPGAPASSNPKPHPDPVHFALDKLGVSAGEARFVGDSPRDMAAGRAAGTRTAALWGPFPREVLLAERPDALLHRQEDVLALIG